MGESARERELYERARLRWPHLDVGAEMFARHLASKAGEAQTDHVEDLYLACACAHGSKAALEAFDEQYAREVERACRKTTLSFEPADVAQMLREKLFLPSGERPPKIADYSGRAPLRVWLRVTLMRMVQNLATRGPREKPGADEAILDLPAAIADPELDAVRRRYQDAFEQAWREAFAALPANDRALLRQRFKSGLTQEELARAYDVHVNTVARWLVRARQSLERSIREHIEQSLRLEPGEFTSLLRVVQSQLDLTLE